MNRKRILLWTGAAAVAAAALAQLVPARPPALQAEERRAVAVAAERRDARFAALPEREPIGKARGELFGPAWTPEAHVAKAAVAAPALPEKPAAPPMPYRVAGQVVQEDGMRVVLTKGDRVFEVRPGETLEDGYRVESIGPHGVTLVYVPLGLKQEVAVAGAGLDLDLARAAAAPAGAAAAPQAAAAAAPRAAAAAAAEPPRAAQLRFEGPHQVQAGTPFDVALKVISPQAVRSLPLQLRFDAKRLEPLAVRAGDFFADGSFTYRVNPGGSIFVGASGSGRVAADADFLIVTFRPIASGSAALEVSSLLLQGAAGRAIAHEPPQAFRAAIVQ